MLTILLVLGGLFFPAFAHESTQVVDERMAYLSPLPSMPVPAMCNCMSYAKALGIKNVKIDEPIVGGGIILNEGPIGHIAIVIEIREDGYVIVESNYVSCTITYRFLAYDYNRIRYFVK